MLSDTLYVVFHISLVNKSLQFNLYRIKNIPLVHLILKKSFKYIDSPLYTADSSHSCSYALFLKDRVKIYAFCILSVIYQIWDETHNINDNLWAISTPR